MTKLKYLVFTLGPEIVWEFDSRMVFEEGFFPTFQLAIFFQAGSNIPKAFFDPSMNPVGAASGSGAVPPVKPMPVRPQSDSETI